MKRMTALLLLALFFVAPGQAGDPTSIEEVYQDGAGALEAALAAYKATPAGQDAPLISSVGDALLGLLKAYEGCHTINHEDIYDLADILFGLINDLSFPCNDEDAYEQAQGIADVAGVLRYYAGWADFLGLPTSAANPTKVDAIDENPDPPLCTVRLEVYVGEILGSPSLLKPGQVGKSVKTTRFADWKVRATGAHPAGGTFSFSAAEQDGHPVNVQQELLATDTVIVGLKSPTPKGFYAVDVKVIYSAPNGATCEDKGTILVSPE